jgi:hypothetical protein
MEITEHVFFDGIDWGNLPTRQSELLKQKA